MRLRFKCEIVSNNSLLHFNYKESLHGLLCNIIQSVDKENLFKSIHDRKDISPYCFSPISFYKGSDIVDGGLKPKSKLFSFNVSFSNDMLFELCKNFSSNGIYMLNDSLFFKVVMVDSLKIPNLDKVTFKADDTQFKIQTENRKQISLALDSPNYKTIFFKNLIKKYRHLSNDYDTQFNIDDYSLDILDSKQRLEIYKHGKIRHHVLRFKLDCPETLKRVGLMCGIGNGNGIGFGYLNIV